MSDKRVRLTAFGRWVRKQPYGVLERAARETGLSRISVVRAQKKLMSTDVAILLSGFTRGAVSVDEIAKSDVGKRARLSA